MPPISSSMANPACSVARTQLSTHTATVSPRCCATQHSTITQAPAPTWSSATVLAASRGGMPKLAERPVWKRSDPGQGSPPEGDNGSRGWSRIADQPSADTPAQLDRGRDATGTADVSRAGVGSARSGNGADVIGSGNGSVARREAAPAKAKVIPGTDRNSAKRGTQGGRAGRQSSRGKKAAMGPKESGGPAVAEALARHMLLQSREPAEFLDDALPHYRDITRLIGFLLEWGHLPLVLQILDWTHTQRYLEKPRSYYYSKVMAHLSASEDESAFPIPDKPILQLYHSMQDNGVQTDKLLLNTLILALGKAGQWALSQQSYQELLGRQPAMKPDTYTYSALIKACQVCGNRWKMALDYFDEAKAAGVALNVVVYTTLLSCLQRAGQWKRALAMFREMERAGHRADVKVYNAAITCCARGGLWEDAWEVAGTMRRLRVWPNLRTYNALISACERAGEPQRALEAYNRMLRDASGGVRLRPTLTTYNTLMSACGKGGMYEQASELYASMCRQGIAPDVYTLSALIMACKACNYWEEAMEVAQEFSIDHGVRLNTTSCNALIATLGKAGRWQYALQYFTDLVDGRLAGEADSWSYTAMALAYRRGQQHSAVLDTYWEMRSQGMPIYKDVHFGVLEACERLGLWKEGGEVLRFIQANEGSSMVLGTGLDVAGWQAVFSFPPLMDSVPKPIIAAARAAIGTGRLARAAVDPKLRRGKKQRDADEHDGNED